MTDTHDYPFKEVEEILRIERDMLADGHTQAEVDRLMLELRAMSFNDINDKLLAEGRSREEIQAFWEELNSFGDTEHDDIFSADDEAEG